MDIQLLKDGTPVLNHDDTAHRTLNGVSRPIRDLSREERDSATIKHPTGGAEAATVTLDKLLDEFDDRGYTSLYLNGSTMPDESVDEIKDAGIKWVGPSKKLPKNEMRKFAKAGFHVAPYTLETAKDGQRLPSFIDDYFTDDATG
jgi:glycerophosphoryl diester phosphodiesterase